MDTESLGVTQKQGQFLSSVLEQHNEENINNSWPKESQQKLLQEQELKCHIVKNAVSKSRSEITTQNTGINKNVAFVVKEINLKNMEDH